MTARVANVGGGLALHVLHGALWLSSKHGLQFLLSRRVRKVKDGTMRLTTTSKLDQGLKTYDQALTVITDSFLFEEFIDQNTEYTFSFGRNTLRQH